MKRFLCLAAGFAVVAFGSAAHAAVLYSQTPSSTANAARSDASFLQGADDFTLPAAGTLRSVTWRGVYANTNTVVFPLTFDLIVYGNSGTNLPDTGSVLSSTTVQFTAPAQVTDTGITFAAYTVYEFTANVTPVALAAATPYWFSALGETTNNVNDDFYWTTGDTSEATARRFTPSGAYAATSQGPMYFVLNDMLVPEPATLALVGLGSLALLARHRRA